MTLVCPLRAFFCRSAACAMDSCAATGNASSERTETTAMVFIVSSIALRASRRAYLHLLLRLNRRFAHEAQQLGTHLVERLVAVLRPMGEGVHDDRLEAWRERRSR